MCDSEVQARRLKRAGTVFVGAFSAQACGDYATGSNHVLPTSGSGCGARRVERGRLCARRDASESDVRRFAAHRARRHGTRRSGRTDRTCGVGADATQWAVGDCRQEQVVSFQYERVVTPASGLRLHLNENTAGCSPKVVDALQALTRRQAAFYPDYDEVIGACAAYLGVARDQIAAHQWARRGNPRRAASPRCGGLPRIPSAKRSFRFQPSTCTPLVRMLPVAASSKCPQARTSSSRFSRFSMLSTSRTGVIFLTTPGQSDGQAHSAPGHSPDRIGRPVGRDLCRRGVLRLLRRDADRFTRSREIAERCRRAGRSPRRMDWRG